MAETLRVVTPARWLAEDFAAAAPAGLQVVHDLGLDLSEDAASTSWWCPMNFAARLLASGLHPGFTAPGPGFTAALPEGVLGRQMVACPLWLAQRAGKRWRSGPVHAKVAEAKLQDLPAAVYPDLGAFLLAAQSQGVPPWSWVQLSDPVHMTSEARCFVLYGQVSTASVYLHGGVTWDGFGSVPDADWAAGFADGVLSLVDRQPPAFTLDVARLDNGDLVVVEANPVWSSNPYHADLECVIPAVLAGQGVSGSWAWRPDPAIRSRRYPLPRRLPADLPR